MIKKDYDGIWQDAAATVEEVGPLPERMEDAPHFANWCCLMRRHDSRLRALTDDDIRKALDEV
jgi:hypothetical protein